MTAQACGYVHKLVGPGILFSKKPKVILFSIFSESHNPSRLFDGYFPKLGVNTLFIHLRAAKWLRSRFFYPGTDFLRFFLSKIFVQFCDCIHFYAMAITKSRIFRGKCYLPDYDIYLKISSEIFGSKARF